MKAAQATELLDALRKHLLNGLEFLYKAAAVGNNRLELGDHKVEHYDGGEVEIVAIDVEFSKQSGKTVSDLIYYTNRDGGNYGYCEFLDLETLALLLAATEKVVGTHYDAEFLTPKAF